MSTTPGAAAEIGRSLVVDGVPTNVHDTGQGPPVVLIHGSGPGVSAWANWRLTMPELSPDHRVIAPDLFGFGATIAPPGTAFGMDAWLAHLIGILDELELGEVDVVGNSFGGALALALAIRHPERVGRLVLMGSVGLSFPLTPGLDEVWGYEPSVEGMRRLLEIFAHDQSLVSDDLAELRYQASIRPGVQESYAAMFPAPRQRWVDAMASPESQITAIQAPTLIIHGRDDQVIPLDVSLRLADLIGPAELHVFNRCGHWTQIEHATRFNRLVADFLSPAATT